MLTKEQNKYLKKVLKRADKLQEEAGLLGLDLVMAGQAANPVLQAQARQAQSANISLRKALSAFAESQDD